MSAFIEEKLEEEIIRQTLFKETGAVTRRGTSRWQENSGEAHRSEAHYSQAHYSETQTGEEGCSRA